MNGRSFWLVLGTGVAIGASAALLYAPQSGVVTRRKLRNGIEDAEGYLEGAGDYLKEQAERLSKEAQKALRSQPRLRQWDRRQRGRVPRRSRQVRQAREVAGRLTGILTKHPVTKKDAPDSLPGRLSLWSASPR